MSSLNCKGTDGADGIQNDILQIMQKTSIVPSSLIQNIGKLGNVKCGDVHMELSKFPISNINLLLFGALLKGLPKEHSNLNLSDAHQ